MALRSLPRAVLTICICILTAQFASAQTITPSNDTSSFNTTTQFIMDSILEMSTVHFPLLPLTPQAGLQGSLQDLKAINPQGPLVLTNTSSVTSLVSSDIAYLSCEPGDYAKGAIDASKIIDLAAGRGPNAIVFYSVFASQCTFNAPGGFSYNSLYTMISANASATVLAGLLKNDPPTPNTQIGVNQNSFNGSGNGNGDGGNVLGKSPTTAVAMIILYSITGIITALFLTIIVVGAIRAHRHPERYGPRRVLGRPRQSRARGIARAMLETLPIVKFGDKEDDKPQVTGQDVELGNATQANGANNTQEPGEQSRESGTEVDNAPAADGPDVVTTVAAADTVQGHEGTSDPAIIADNGLACSVCTDDFVKGQDIRVLPCKHKFHPECIDPWLLNVSGTCPLCRVDLHPTTSHDSDHDGLEYEDGPSLETRDWEGRETQQVESVRRHRRSRILHTLNIGRMRHATPEERIAALRRLRSENETSDSFAEQGSSVGNTFSRRISRAFGGSRGGSRRASATLNSRPVSEIPTAAVEPAAPTTTEIGPPIAEVTSHGTVEPASPANETALPPPITSNGVTGAVAHPNAEEGPSRASEIVSETRNATSLAIGEAPSTNIIDRIPPVTHSR